MACYQVRLVNVLIKGVEKGISNKQLQCAAPCWGETQIQLIFYRMKVSQGHSERHVNTIPECRCISLFYKSQRDESLSDHYYHTNRQIYLTTLFLSHNTYSLVLHPERRWNVSLPHSPPLPPLFFLFLFSREMVSGLIKAQSNRRSKADIFLRDDRKAKSNRMEQSLFHR